MQQFGDVMKGLSDQTHDKLLYNHFDTIFDTLHDQLDQWINGCDQSVKMGEQMRDQVGDSLGSVMGNTTDWSHGFWKCQSFEDLIEWQQEVINEVSGKVMNDMANLADQAMPNCNNSYQMFKFK